MENYIYSVGRNVIFSPVGCVLINASYGSISRLYIRRAVAGYIKQGSSSIIPTGQPHEILYLDTVAKVC